MRPVFCEITYFSGRGAFFFPFLFVSAIALTKFFPLLLSSDCGGGGGAAAFGSPLSFPFLSPFSGVTKVYKSTLQHLAY